MKSFNIRQALDFIDNNTPFNSNAVRDISFVTYSLNQFEVIFNDETHYHIDMDNETYYQR